MRLPPLSGILALALLPFLSGPAAAKARVVYPKDGTAVSTATVTVLGGVTDVAGEPVRLILNGQAQAPVVKPNGFFSLSVRLQPGVNVLEVEDRVIRLSFLGKDQPLPIGFMERYLHPPVLEDCGNCHEPKTPGDFAVSGPVMELCLGCHDDPTLGKDKKKLSCVHSPIADGGECTACHDPHAGDTPALNIRSLPGLCYECHDKVTGKGDEHGPVLAGDCTSCHSPHASLQPKLLIAKGPRLCLACHDDPVGDPAAKGNNLPVVHAALDEGCLACHEAHSAKVKGLLRKAQAQTCWECHDQGQVPAGKEGAAHDPIASDGECSACHLPHASREKNLLLKLVPQLCLECHEDPGGGGKAYVHGPVKSGACTECHNPHQGGKGLLVRKYADLCTSCHGKVPAIPGGSRHAPVEEGECDSCHFSHAGPKKLLRRAVPALCSDCHEDPAAGGDGKKLAYVHTPVADGDCLSCHQWHFSPFPKLLVQKGNPLCFTCHDDPSLGPGKKPWFARHDPVSRDCGSCHLAHAGPAPANLRGPVYALCSSCHESHPGHPLDASGYMDTRSGALVSLPASVVLTSDGMMVCTGCHRAHGGADKSLLVKKRDQFCTLCHTM